MKKKLGLLGVLAAVLVLGIGYAVISDIDLSVSGTGTITPSDANFDVVFDTTDGPYTNTEVTGATLDADYTNGLTATISVEGFTKKGDSAQFSYAIKNNSDDLAAALSIDSTTGITNSNSTYFEVEANLVDDTIASKNDAEEAEDDSNITYLMITVTAKKTPATANQTADISVTVTATPDE